MKGTFEHRCVTLGRAASRSNPERRPKTADIWRIVTVFVNSMTSASLWRGLCPTYLVALQGLKRVCVRTFRPFCHQGILPFQSVQARLTKRGFSICREVQPWRCPHVRSGKVPPSTHTGSARTPRCQSISTKVKCHLQRENRKTNLQKDLLPRSATTRILFRLGPQQTYRSNNLVKLHLDSATLDEGIRPYLGQLYSCIRIRTVVAANLSGKCPSLANWRFTTSAAHSLPFPLAKFKIAISATFTLRANLVMYVAQLG